MIKVGIWKIIGNNLYHYTGKKYDGQVGAGHNGFYWITYLTTGASRVIHKHGWADTEYLAKQKVLGNIRND